jgi:hypothetical protein
MIYVPNRIGIPTHGGDLGHHEHRKEGENPESPMEPPPTKRGQREEKEVPATFYAHQSCQFHQRDWVAACQVSRLMKESRQALQRDLINVARLVPPWRPIMLVHVAPLLHKSFHMDCCDWKGPDLEKKIWSGSFLEIPFWTTKIGKTFSDRGDIRFGFDGQKSGAMEILDILTRGK